jgi:hypothetical protein
MELFKIFLKYVARDVAEILEDKLKIIKKFINFKNFKVINNGISFRKSKRNYILTLI